MDVVPKQSDTSKSSNLASPVSSLSSLSISTDSISPSSTLTRSCEQESLLLSHSGKNLADRLNKLIERAKTMADESDIMAEEFCLMAKEFALLSKRKKVLAQKFSGLKDQLQEELTSSLTSCSTTSTTASEMKSSKVVVADLTGNKCEIDLMPMPFNDFIASIIKNLSYPSSALQKKYAVIIKGIKYTNDIVDTLTTDMIDMAISSKKIHIMKCE